MVTTGLIIGVGRQSEALVRLLAPTQDYHLLVFTRSETSKISLQLKQLPNVEIVVNPAKHGYDPDSFFAAAKRSQFVFVNTDGFELGEQAETYWGIRLFELSRKANVQHLIYSGLDYASRDSGFDDSLYVGHYEGKARVQRKPTDPCHTMKATIANEKHRIYAFPAQVADGLDHYSFRALHRESVAALRPDARS